LLARAVVLMLTTASSRNAVEFIIVGIPFLLTTAFAMFSLLLSIHRTWVHRFGSFVPGLHALIGAIALFATVASMGHWAGLHPTAILLPCPPQLFVIMLFHRFAFGRPSHRYFGGVNLVL